MSDRVAPEVAARLREDPPLDHGVIPGSLPVVSFGDFATAGVATISLNPSDKEFLDNHGNWLLGRRRRLESLNSLGLTSPSQLTDELIKQVLQRNNDYFSGNPFLSWFSHLNRLLLRAGVGSYFDGSACHLDLVQWSTKPKQGQLAPGVWPALVERDRRFLQWQLEHSNIKVVLANGKGVVDQLQTAGLLGPVETQSITFAGTKKGRTLRVFKSAIGPTVLLGWNLPLAQGVADDGIEKLAAWIAGQLRL